MSYPKQDEFVKESPSFSAAGVHARFDVLPGSGGLDVFMTESEAIVFAGFTMLWLDRGIVFGLAWGVPCSALSMQQQAKATFLLEGIQKSNGDEASGYQNHLLLDSRWPLVAICVTFFKARACLKQETMILEASGLEHLANTETRVHHLNQVCSLLLSIFSTFLSGG